MKVKELIELLQKMDPEYEALIEDGEYFRSAEKVGIVRFAEAIIIQ